MVTASHNKYTDNGFKISSLNGENIPSEWKGIYTNIVNTKNLIQDFKSLVVDLLNQTATIKYYFRDVTPIIILCM